MAGRAGTARSTLGAACPGSQFIQQHDRLWGNQQLPGILKIDSSLGVIFFVAFLQLNIRSIPAVLGVRCAGRAVDRAQRTSEASGHVLPRKRTTLKVALSGP